MELQLNKKDLTCMVLTVLNSINKQDARMLRLGFKKLLAQARNAFLIDFTQAQIEQDAEVVLLELQLEAILGKIRLVMIGNNPNICQATNAKDAKLLTASMIKLDKIIVPQLIVLYKSFDERLAKAKSIIDGEDASLQWTEIEALNRELNIVVADLENRVQRLFDEHTTPVDPGSAKIDKKNVTEKILASLEGEVKI